MVADGPPSPLDAVHVLSCLYRRVSTRVRIGVWAPDGRSTPVRPPLVADPLGGSAKPQYGISKNLMSGINGLPFLHALNFY